MKSLQQLGRIYGRLMIEMLEKNILEITYSLNLFLKKLLVKELTYLEADLCIFIGIERSNSRFGGSKGFASKPFLLLCVEKHMIGHHYLTAVADKYLWHGNALIRNVLYLIKKLCYIECHTVSDNTCGM